MGFNFLTALTGLVEIIKKSDAVLDFILNRNIPKVYEFVYTNLEQASKYAIEQVGIFVDKARASKEKYDDTLVEAAIDFIDAVGDTLKTGAVELRARLNTPIETND